MKTYDYVFVSVDLNGGKVFNSHNEAYADYKKGVSEFRGVFQKTQKGIEGVNVSGSIFDNRSTQLKKIAKAVVSRKEFPKDLDIFVSRQKTDEDDKRALFTIEPRKNLSDWIKDIYFVAKKEDVASWYEPVTEIVWKKIDSKVLTGLELDTDESSIYFDKGVLSAMIDRTSYVLAESLEGKHEAGLYAREYLEILREANSQGWDSNDVLPLPLRNMVQFRDLEARNVWKSPVCREDIYKNKPDYESNAAVPAPDVEEKALAEAERFYKMACLADQVVELELGTAGDIELIMQLGENDSFQAIIDVFDKDGKYKSAEKMLDIWIGESLESLNKLADKFGFERIPKSEVTQIPSLNEDENEDIESSIGLKN